MLIIWSYDNSSKENVLTHMHTMNLPKDFNGRVSTEKRFKSCQEYRDQWSTVVHILCLKPIDKFTQG